DNAWQKILSTQELNQRFYRELVDWFTWTKTEIKLARLPDHTENNERNRDIATQQFTVRLICRTLFAWFLKEMRLVPPELLELYDAADRRRVLTAGNYDPKGNHYYRGILQNVFFQALNRPMNQRRKAGPEAASDRTVTKAELKKLAYLGKNQLPETFDYGLLDRIPYLNGGLFDALPEDNASDTIEDGALHIPNKLFYATTADGFTIEVGGKKKIKRSVEGLNRIFDRYRFTVAENTPLEEDVALDPELLGLVFENLLAEIDPDDEAAAESARKASGSYYTPRRIVDYMVNEALHLHLRTEFEKQSATPEDFQLLSRLCYELPDDADFSSIADRVVDVLESVRVLDPACGSGAFPMGMLHRMVELLARVDRNNERWIQRLLARLPAPMRTHARQGMEGKSYNYLRKLGLIQKNLYGLDIQPLAALIAKLRFFLTLVIEQEVHPADRAHNYGLQALPNLETNLLCANTLNDADHGLLSVPVLRELREVREEYYQPNTSHERRDELALTIGAKLATLFPGFAEKTKGIRPTGATQIDRENMRLQQDAAWLTRWFKHATVAAPFFNVETFFPELIGEGAIRHPAPFHIVIGNPPYGVNVEDSVRNPLGLGSKDSYGAFIARFLGAPQRPSPLAEGGVLAYIVSDTFMTIKTHRPLREQMLGHQVHKMIRVSGDTFKAVVNCAVILCQRGAAPEEHTCQMADLTNVSIHDQYERFLHLLYQTEGFSRRQNVANQTYAIYHYRQSLIPTNSNLPFFVASPKLFALMNDTTAPVRHETIGGKRVPVRTVQLNGREVRLAKLGDIAEVKVGLQTGDNDAYLFQNPDARGSYRSIEDFREFLLTDADLERIRLDENLRSSVVERGISKDGRRSNRYFGGRYIVPYDKGGESESGEGWMPNYWVTTDYFIDWSEWAISRMKSLTLREKLRLQGQTGGDDRLTSRFQNQDFYFVPGLTWSDVGVYSPTIRLSGAGVFDVKGSRFVVPINLLHPLLGVVCSKLAKMWIKAIENHSVSTQSDNIRGLIIPAEQPSDLGDRVQEIIAKQKASAAYDYASNEQVEIDRLVYAAYGLNEADIREVEDWYARRYPKLAAAQRRALAAKQGKTEEQLVARTTLHLYCDESRHLPHDREPFMLLGLVSCPADKVRAYHLELREIWRKHRLPDHWEAKWTKVSPVKAALYHDVLEWFFRTEGVE
ncbi:MAG: Eco57I restriction-modification methylase domain-containing protein, partial [Terrimicrobiaceae bacterium]